MVVGAKMTLQHVPSKGQLSMKKLQNFTVQKRYSVARIVYGAILIVIGVLMVATNPIELATNWYMEMREGSAVFHMWETPTYKIENEIWVYNYTNVPEYMNGDSTILKLKEIGPFTFQETRLNENLTIDKKSGTIKMKPRIILDFLKEKSIGDSKDIMVFMPNIAVIAISTLAADKLGYFANTGVHVSVKAMGCKLFRSMTVEELFWGYYDPIVTISNKLLPGWINFEKIGILDRFYAHHDDTAEVEIEDPKKKYSIKSWNNSPGLMEQGFTDINTSIPCNRIEGSYEGLSLTPNYPKNKEIPVFRKQACRIYPFDFDSENIDENGIKLYRYLLAKSAFNRSSPYACKCNGHCVPDGFVDVSNCYYGFPITLSKPHYLDVDPVQASNFEGMYPDPKKHVSSVDLEPSLGVPLSLSIKIQVNIAVRTSPANPITKAVKDKVLPILWLSLSCKKPPSDVSSLLWLRFIVAPPTIIVIEVLLFFTGFFIGAQGFHRIIKPNYMLIKTDIKRNSLTKAATLADISEYTDIREFKKTISLITINLDCYEVPELLDK